MSVRESSANRLAPHRESGANESTSQLTARVSNLVKATQQAQREEKAGTFTDERKKKFLAFCAKLNWQLQDGVEVADWDGFFEILEKMLLSPNVIDLLLPATQILTGIFSVQHRMIDDSELIEADLIKEIDFSRLLKNGHFQEYTDFLLSLHIGENGQRKEQIESIEETMGKHEVAIEACTGKIETLLDIMDQKTNSIGQRLNQAEDQVELTLQLFQQRNDLTSERLEGVNERLDRLEQEMIQVRLNQGSNVHNIAGRSPQTTLAQSISVKSQQLQQAKQVQNDAKKSTQALLEQLKQSIMPKTQTPELPIAPSRQNQSIYSEKIMNGSKNIQVNQSKAVSDYSYIRNGPQIDVHSLRSDRMETRGNKLDELQTMKGSKELSLKEIFKAEEGRKSRYNRQELDADDKTVLKSVISKVVSQKSNTGETSDQLQERIMNELYAKLADKFAAIKEGHEENMVKHLKTMSQAYEKQLQEKMDAINAEHQALIETKLGYQQQTAIISTVLDQVASEQKIKLEMKLSELEMEQQNKISSQLGQLNQDQETNMHQLRVSYGNKVNQIRESLANKIMTLKQEQQMDRQALLTENQEQWLATQNNNLDFQKKAREELHSTMHASKEALLQHVLQAQRELDEQMKAIKKQHEDHLAQMQIQYASQFKTIQVENDEHVQMLIDERNEITKRFQAENERIIQTLNFEKNEMMMTLKKESKDTLGYLLTEKDELVNTLKNEHQAIQLSLMKSRDEFKTKLITEHQNAHEKLLAEKQELVNTLKYEHQENHAKLLTEKDLLINALKTEQLNLQTEREILVNTLKNEQQTIHENLISEKDEFINKLMNEHQKGQERLLAEKNELVNTLKNEQQENHTKLLIEKDLLINEIKTQQLNLQTEKDILLSALKNEQQAIQLNLMSEKEDFMSKLMNEQQNVQRNLLNEKDELVSTLKNEHQAAHMKLLTEKDNMISNLITEKNSAIEKLQIEKHQVLTTLINEKEMAIKSLITERDEQIKILTAEKDKFVGNVLVEKDQFVKNLIKEKNMLISRLSSEKEVLLDRLKTEYKYYQTKLQSEYEARQKTHQRAQENQVLAMRVKYEVQIERCNATIEGFRKDLEIFKTNLIATGQLTPSYSLVEGNRLAGIVQKLQSNFEFFCRDTNDRQTEIQQDVGMKISKFMSDTQGVFDSMLRDISALQKGLASIDVNHDLETLETHLTERIATFTENAMEVNAVQSETLQNLHDKVQEIIIRVNEEKKRCKNDLLEQIDIREAKNNQIFETIKNVKEQNERMHEICAIKFAEIYSAHQEIVQKNHELDGVKTSMTLSMADRGRLDELTDFYRHLNSVVDSIIDKFSTMERVTNKFMKNQPVVVAQYPNPYTPKDTLRPGMSDQLMPQAMTNNNQLRSLMSPLGASGPQTTPHRINASVIVFEDSNARQIGQDTEPPQLSHLQPLHNSAVKNKQEFMQDGGTRVSNTAQNVNFETMIPASTKDQLNGLDVKSQGASIYSVEIKNGSFKKYQQANDAAEELKSKVSVMMSNHSLLVEDLKAQSAKKSLGKRDSVVLTRASIPFDTRSVDTHSHEIDAHNRTLDNQSRRKQSSQRRGESPLRAGASLQLSRKNAPQ